MARRGNSILSMQQEGAGRDERGEEEAGEEGRASFAGPLAFDLGLGHPQRQSGLAGLVESAIDLHDDLDRVGRLPGTP